MTKSKWKKFEGENDSYALCTWAFRREPGQCVVSETAPTLEEACSMIPRECNCEESVDVIHVGQWITDGNEVVPHPQHITTLFTITPHDDDPSDDV
jgi:hypothetical protein